MEVSLVTNSETQGQLLDFCEPVSCFVILLCYLFTRWHKVKGDFPSTLSKSARINE